MSVYQVQSVGLFYEIDTYSTLFNGLFRSVGYRRAETGR